MKLTFISDTHSLHSQVELESGDILIHCGDISTRGELYEIQTFANFISSLNFKYKIVIAGNHDFCFENKNKEKAEKALSDLGIIYLNDSGVEIDGVQFWGSPVQPEFFDWAFNRKRGEDIKRHWNLIPAGTDVLITHGPPFGILDKVKKGENVGCEDLLAKINEIRPKIHAFGHIHEAYGSHECNGTTFINASSLNAKYKYRNKPIVVNI